MANTYLTRSVTTTGNQKTWTFSAWVKRSKLGTTQFLISAKNVGETTLHFRGEDDLQLELYDGNNYYIRTTRLFRDTNAWYHIVAIWDSVRPTSSDRMRLYVNGVQETSLSAAVYPPQNYDSYVNQSGELNQIGTYAPASTPSFDGSMSHFHLIDGNDYNASYFGEYDANGVWTIKTDVSVTYGTNGFFILKDGNSVTDQSGNSNNFTVGGGTLTKTEDCPSNVFATLNSLNNFLPGATFSNGNNTIQTKTNSSAPIDATLGVTSGKYYWECKWSAQPTGSSNQVLIGIAKRPAPSSTTWLGSAAYTYGYQGSDGHVKVSGGNATGSSATTYSVGDIISVALDLDNNKLHFAKNGSWTNSSDPAGNSGGITITTPDSTSGDSGFYFAAFGDGNSSLQETGQFNFGNGYFGTTAVASAGTNASGIGIFEYDVPTGFTALSTKGLNL